MTDPLKSALLVAGTVVALAFIGYIARRRSARETRRQGHPSTTAVTDPRAAAPTGKLTDDEMRTVTKGLTLRGLGTVPLDHPDSTTAILERTDLNPDHLAADLVGIVIQAVSDVTRLAADATHHDTAALRSSIAELAQLFDMDPATSSPIQGD